MIAKIYAFALRHKRHWPAAALAFGFVFDFFTLTRVDGLYDNVVLLFYILVAASGILLFNILHQKELWPRFQEWLPVIIQFAFGGLFSGFSIFYLRSATFSINILFVVLLIYLMIANEAYKERYQRIIFQITTFYFILLSYLILVMPLLLRSVGVTVFLTSGALSLVIIGVFIWILNTVARQEVQKWMTSIVAGVVTLFLFVNVFYFAGIIPPIPLSLKDVNAYHYVERSGSTYTAQTEVKEWYEYVSPFDIVHLQEGQPVYVFSSVFSPTDIDTKIYHHWQYFDEDTDSWESTGRIGYTLFGGRDAGFRGYTQKSNIFPGRWRVDVETERGQLIGRETFRIEFVSQSVELKEIEL